MKKIVALFASILSFVIISCSSNEDEFVKNTTITLNFSHKWDDRAISDTLVNRTDLVNLMGDRLSIERLRYLISNVYLENSSGIITDITDFILVDVGENLNLTFTTENLLLDGSYDAHFTFGFSEEDNNETYTELDDVNLNLPDSLGGGYYFMQLEGQFIDNTAMMKRYNYHTIRAVDSLENETPFFNDTSFSVNLGEISIENNAAIIDIEMDVREWFQNTNTWDLNVYNQSLITNYNAQLKMRANGATVFSLKEEEEEE